MRVKPGARSAWPAWRYGPNGEGEIFQCEEDVPEGWTRKPGTPEILRELPPTVVLNREELVAELLRRNTAIDPKWGNAHMKRIIDGDISPTR